MRQLRIEQTITRRTDNIDRLLRDIEKRKLISAEEEVNLALRIQKGDKEAEKRLVEANLRFLFSVAKQFQFKGTELGDLIGDGSLGLIKAAKKFDPSRGFKFISFAVWWVRQSILEGLNQNSRIIRLPGNQVTLSNKYRDAVEELEQKLQRAPSDQEIRTHLEMTEDSFRLLVKAQAKTLSFDLPFEDGETNTLLDVVPDQGTPTDASIEVETIRTQLFRSMSCLNEKEKEVITLFFGLNENNHALSTEEISNKMKLCRERIRQIKDSALGKLRRKAVNFLRESIN